ncbi:MAG: cytochrome P450, partial [Solirubrobacteraceae bacterium]|nr:cytochrome P450 [Solirubrobacteraceae bacterium]
MTATHYRMPPRMRGTSPGNTARFILGGPVRYAGRQRALGLGAVSLQIPGLGAGISVTDPKLIKQVYTAPADVVHGADEAPLAVTLGSLSPFALDEDRHLAQRRLLLPPFHGARMGGYGAIFEEEALREIATWPLDHDFRTLEPMSRITLRAILRTVFGVADRAFDELLAFLPQWVRLGSYLTTVPQVHHDLGPWSPWGRFLRYRKRFDAAIQRLIAEGRADARLEERDDVLAMLLQARYDDGQPITDAELKDQLLAILVAGHETTANQLAWGTDRLRRHPELIWRLREEALAGRSELREATIRELQRSRPVVGGTLRWVRKDFALGDWLLPPGTLIYIDAVALHHDPALYPRPSRFDPDRFLGKKPATYEWVPFGGGRRRCVGAAFAHLEMDVILRTLLLHVEMVPTTARPEGWRFRGVAWAPAKGGVMRIRARAAAPGPASNLRLVPASTGSA